MLSFITLSSKKSPYDYNEIIHKALINDDIYYEIHNFTDINKSFNQLCEMESQTNIFIIENNDNINAIEITNQIREEYNAVTTFIIIINRLNSVDYNKLNKNQHFLTDIVSDNNNIEKRIKEDIKYILTLLENHKKCLTILKDKLIYKIPYSDIYYIEKELNGKRATIVTKKQELSIFKSLNELQKILDNRFSRSHQSAIINMDNVKVVNFECNKIIFAKNVECLLISRSFKKELRKEFTKREMQITK